MKAGPMHDAIRIDAPDEAIDGMVAPRPTWHEIWRCPAQIQTLSAREYFSQQREGASASVRIYLRHPPSTVNVTAQCRAVDEARGIFYAIEAVLYDDKQSVMTLACTSGENDG